MGYEWLNDEWGGGERSRKVNSRWMYFESSTQNEGFWRSSTRTWIRDSSARRKNPRPDGSGEAREEITDTEETDMVTWPVWVKPNRSKRIMDRESELILRDLISAAMGRSMVKKRRIGRRKCSNLVIFHEIAVANGSAVRRRGRWIWKQDHAEDKSVTVVYFYYRNCPSIFGNGVDLARVYILIFRSRKAWKLRDRSPK